MGVSKIKLVLVTEFSYTSLYLVTLINLILAFKIKYRTKQFIETSLRKYFEFNSTSKTVSLYN